MSDRQSGNSRVADAEEAESRAEELMEDWGERAASWLSAAVARAREELEDIWADAQSVRRGQ